eukprot:scpid25186/ scgid29520/ NF-kappa-B-repressing factor; Transcription factor NRF
MCSLSKQSADLQRSEFVAGSEDDLGRPLAEALANVHYNIILMGCRYPQAVEDRVRQWKPTTWESVTACKGRSAPTPVPRRESKAVVVELEVSAAAVANDVPVDAADCHSINSTTAAAAAATTTPDGATFPPRLLSLAQRMRMRACENEQLYVAKLNDAGQLSRVVVDYVTSEMDSAGMHSVSVVIDSVHVARGSAPQKKSAKHLAAKNAFERLRAAQQSLGITVVPSGMQVIKEAKSHIDHADLVSKTYHDADKVSENSKGSMLLKKMGYSGTGGLGKDGQGRAEPVIETGTSGTGHRHGIGAMEEGDLDKTRIEHLLRDFLSSDEESLVFGKGLAKENRAIVHTLSQRMGLLHRSHGQGEGRQLVVQKRPGSAVANNGGAHTNRRRHTTQGSEIAPPHHRNSQHDDAQYSGQYQHNYQQAPARGGRHPRQRQRDSRRNQYTDGPPPPRRRHAPY